jgi:hypothetical protein
MTQWLNCAVSAMVLGFSIQVNACLSLFLRSLPAGFFLRFFCLFDFSQLVLGAVPMFVGNILRLPALLPNLIGSFTDQIVSVDHGRLLLIKCVCSDVRQLRRFGLRASQAPDQNWVTCFVIAALACAVAFTRVRPAPALALLSHMLMNGFFLSHGFATGVLPAGIAERKRFSRANGLSQ